MISIFIRFFCLLFFLPFSTLAQDANTLVAKLSAKMNQVKDYSVQVRIQAQIPLINIFPVNGTIYYKQADKFRIIAKGIAILPKQGFTDLSQLLSKKERYSAIFTKTEQVNEVMLQVVNLLPTDESGDLILVKLWIDGSKELLIKSQTTTRSSGTVTANYKYGKQQAIGLPDVLEFTLDAKKFKIPKGLATDINRTSVPAKDLPKTGKITLTFTNYQINKGIDDKVFKN
ncbi:MAG: LolA family protein [Sphingobacteriaceae bacterium]